SDSDAGSGSDSELEDIDAILSPRIKRRPAPVISDEDDDEDGDEPAAPIVRPPSVPEQKTLPPSDVATGSSDKGKSKFLGMFKMPAAKNTTTVVKPRPVPVAATPTPLEPSLPENPVPVSQDLPYLFSSQIGRVGDTQDSLLMTPAEEVTGTRQCDSLMDTQSGFMGHLEQFPDYQETQPTQMMEGNDDDEEVGRIQQTQPTQLTVATDGDAGQDDSLLPTMVRRALVPGAGDNDSDASAEEEEDEVVDDDMEEEAGGSLSPQLVAPAGRLLRRGDIVAQRKQRRRDAKRSEFVEAEAEEGDSSDSDGVTKGVGPRKFNWGDGLAPKPGAGLSDDEEEYDMDSDEEEAALLADPMINNEVDENASEGDEAIRELHRQRDFDEDERNIQTLYNDITTGALKNRVSRNRTGFALADDEDYNDRQTRAERMEERARMKRKLLAREIHDKDLAEIAKNPETAAFARAALMRPPPPTSGSGGGMEDDEMLMLPGDDAFELEEIVDDRHLAMTVQQQLMRTRMRVESDDEDSVMAAVPKARIAGSSQVSSLTDSMPMDELDMDGGAFSSVAVEKLIVRRRTLLAVGKEDGGGKFAPLHRTSSLLKRPGTALLGATAKRLNVASSDKNVL
ncbi:hypothetical protein GGH92_002088, partial [Coemansia sp. RSA 2673]